MLYDFSQHVACRVGPSSDLRIEGQLYDEKDAIELSELQSAQSRIQSLLMVQLRRMRGSYRIRAAQPDWDLLLHHEDSLIIHPVGACRTKMKDLKEEEKVAVVQPGQIPTVLEEQARTQAEQRSRPIYNQTPQFKSPYLIGLYKQLASELNATEEEARKIPKAVAERALTDLQSKQTDKGTLAWISRRISQANYDWKDAGKKLLDAMGKLKMVSRSAVLEATPRYAYVTDSGDLKMLRLNPGLVNLEMPEEVFAAIETLGTHNKAILNKAIHELVTRSIEQAPSSNGSSGALITPEQMGGFLENMMIRMQPDVTKTENLEDFLPKSLIRALLDIKSKFVMNKETYGDILRFVEEVKKVQMMGQSLYLSSLLDPRKGVGVRVPTDFPLPTATFQLSSSLVVTVNASGNAAFAWSPGLQYNAVEMTTFGLNNDVSLDGVSASNYFLGKSIGETLPTTIYTRYRVVSAMLKATCIASALNSSGFMTLGLDATNTVTFGSVGATISNASGYATFGTIENLMYRESKAATPGAESYVRYVPIDTNNLDFQNLGTVVRPALVGYITGMMAGTNALRLELTVNFEAIVNPVYSDYIPSAVPTEGTDSAKQAISSMNAGFAILSPEDARKKVDESSYKTKPDANALAVVPYTGAARKGIWDQLVSAAKDAGIEILKQAPGMIARGLGLMA